MLRFFRADQRIEYIKSAVKSSQIKIIPVRNLKNEALTKIIYVYSIV